MRRSQDNGKGKLIFKGTAKVFPGYIIIRTGLVMLATFVAINLVGQGSNPEKTATEVALVIGVYGVLRLVWEWLRNRFKKFAIYQRGIEFSIGFPWGQKAFLWLSYIDDITLKHSHWDWLNGTATVVLSASSIWQPSNLLSGAKQTGSIKYKLSALGNGKYMDTLYNVLNDVIKEQRGELSVAESGKLRQ